MYKNLHIDSVERNGVGIFRVLNWHAFTGVCWPLMGGLWGKNQKGGVHFLWRRENEPFEPLWRGGYKAGISLQGHQYHQPLLVLKKRLRTTL